jgi:cytochrome c oxidase assembly protein subunit 15
MDFARAFEILRDLGVSADGAPLGAEAMTAIHWTHRLGALITFSYLLVFAIGLVRTTALPAYGAALALFITIQAGLGIANVVFSLPLVVAAAHNGLAAILLALMVVINFALAHSAHRTSVRLSASTPPAQL